MIGAGTQLGGALINANAQGNASDAQAKAAQNALDFQKQVYNQRLAGLQPYQQLGKRRGGKLGSLYGLSVTPPAATPNPTNPATTAPPNQPPSDPAFMQRVATNLSNLGAPTSSLPATPRRAEL